ncbi:MAG: DUF3015 family protein [Gallionella sp.]
MKKIITVFALAFALPSAVLAATDNVGCGAGSMIFKGQSGLAPQVLAATTNGTLGNQTFGISSGTLGCSENGTVHSASLFIDTNKEKLARDMSVGNGETLASLSHLMGMSAEDQIAFNRLAKENVAHIFTSDHVATEQVVSALRDVLASNAQLSRYQTAL